MIARGVHVRSQGRWGPLRRRRLGLCRSRSRGRSCESLSTARASPGGSDSPGGDQIAGRVEIESVDVCVVYERCQIYTSQSLPATDCLRPAQVPSLDVQTPRTIRGSYLEVSTNQAPPLVGRILVQPVIPKPRTPHPQLKQEVRAPTLDSRGGQGEESGIGDVDEVDRRAHV